jgi:hypothetical protein
VRRVEIVPNRFRKHAPEARSTADEHGGTPVRADGRDTRNPTPERAARVRARRKRNDRQVHFMAQDKKTSRRNPHCASDSAGIPLAALRVPFFYLRMVQSTIRRSCVFEQEQNPTPFVKVFVRLFVLRFVLLFGTLLLSASRNQKKKTCQAFISAVPAIPKT